jgi:ABC-type nitrate/sulfonate/bicarbonate transport system ATPase subunit
MDAHTATQNTAFVPASFELVPMLTVEENVALALATRSETLVVDDLACTVDSITRRGAIRTLRRIADELELTVVLATGDAADAALAGHVGDAAA